MNFLKSLDAQSALEMSYFSGCRDVLGVGLAIFRGAGMFWEWD